jgi:hypothetical protein
LGIMFGYARRNDSMIWPLLALALMRRVITRLAIQVVHATPK